MAITRLGGANAITGIIPVTNGGTGASSFSPGKVLQVVQTTKIDHFSTTNNYASLTDVTGLSVSITPSSSSNKVFVMVQIILETLLIETNLGLTFLLNLLVLLTSFNLTLLLQEQALPFLK